MRKSKVLSFVLVAALAVTAIPINAFGTVSDEKNKLSDLQNQKQQAQDENNKLQKSKSDAQEYIQLVDKKLTNLATEMYKTNQKLSKTEDKISKTQKELDKAQVSINEQYEDMKLRIKYMYENGDTQMIDLIFNSKSITDFLNKAEYITELSQYDRDMLNKMKKTKEKIASAKSTLVTEKKNLQTIHAQQKSDQTKLTNLSASKQQELKNYEDLIAHNEATSDELEAEISAQEKRVASAEEQSKTRQLLSRQDVKRQQRNSRQLVQIVVQAIHHQIQEVTQQILQTVEIQEVVEQFQAVDLHGHFRDIQLYLQDMDIEVLNFIRVLIFRHQQEPLLLQQVQVQ